MRIRQIHIALEGGKEKEKPVQVSIMRFFGEAAGSKVTTVGFDDSKQLALGLRLLADEVERYT